MNESARADVAKSFAPVMLPTLAAAAPSPRATPSLTDRRLAVMLSVAGAGIALYPALPRVAGWLTRALFGASISGPLARAFEFFAYDAPKVLFLLTSWSSASGS